LHMAPTALVRFPSQQTLAISADLSSVLSLKKQIEAERGIPIRCQHLTVGKHTLSDEELVPSELLSLSTRVLGGKGGFGALLRGQVMRPGQKKIEDDTSSCRDLNGRRLRHVENEKKIREWREKQAERDLQAQLEKEAKKKRKAPEPVVEIEPPPEPTDPEEMAKAIARGLEEAKRKRAEDLARRNGEEISEAAKTTPVKSATERLAEFRAQQAAEKEQAEKERAQRKTEQPAHAAAEQPKPAEPEALDLGPYSDAKSLEALGPDRLKSALMALGLKCGGTLQQRAERLMSVKGKTKEEIDPKLFAKPAKSS